MPRAAHAAGALLVVDNTFATPLFQQPFALGADLVVHSVTKYLAGHSDVIQGAVLAQDAAVFEPVKFLQNATGAVPSPFDCWLTLRGLKTLELRMQRHADNAEAIAKALDGHPLVKPRLLPWPAAHPGHEIAKRQMTGFGGMVSFELDGTRRGSGLVRLVAAVLRARREPRRRQGAGLSSGADDACVDSGRRTRQARPVGHAGPAVDRLRAPARSRRPTCSKGSRPSNRPRALNGQRGFGGGRVMADRIDVGILGATGVVGQQLLALLDGPSLVSRQLARGERTVGGQTLRRSRRGGCRAPLPPTSAALDASRRSTPPMRRASSSPALDASVAGEAEIDFARSADGSSSATRATIGWTRSCRC